MCRDEPGLKLEPEPERKLDRDDARDPLPLNPLLRPLEIRLAIGIPPFCCRFYFTTKSVLGP